MRLQSTAEINHQEHLALWRQLGELESALQGLVCYAEVYADLGSAEQVHRCGEELRDNIPGHFAHEEQVVLEPVAGMGAQGSAFAREMKRQHVQLQRKLELFCEAMDRLENSGDLEQAIGELKERGLEFTRQMAGHMSVEERRLGNFIRHA